MCTHPCPLALSIRPLGGMCVHEPPRVYVCIGMYLYKCVSVAILAQSVFEQRHLHINLFGDHDTCTVRNTFSIPKSCLSALLTILTPMIRRGVQLQWRLGISDAPTVEPSTRARTHGFAQPARSGCASFASGGCASSSSSSSSRGSNNSSSV